VEDSPQTLGFDRLGNWLFLARNSDGGTLRRLDDGAIQWFSLHNGLGFRGSFAPPAGLVATQSWNGSARVFRISSGRPVSPFMWQTATPGSCILDPRGRWLFTRGDEPAARMWGLREETGATAISKTTAKPVGVWFGGARDALFGADAGDGSVRAWEMEQPRRRIGQAQHAERMLTKAAPSGDGKRFLTAGSRIVQIWDAQTWKPIGKPCEVEEGFVDAATDSGGRRIAMALRDGKVMIRDVGSDAVVASFASGARHVSFSDDGKLLLVVGEDAAQTWDTGIWKPVSPAVAQPSGEARAQFSPDGRRVLQWTAHRSSGQVRAEIWDATTGKIQTVLSPHWQGILDAAWSPDGQMVACGGADQTLLLNDAANGSLVVPPIRHAQKVSAVGFSKDSRLMWSVSDKEVAVWSAVSGEPLTPPLRQLRVPSAIAMSGGNGRELAVAGERAAPRIWQLAADMRPPDELRSIAHALSAHALVGGTSALRPLTLVEMRSAWESARKSLDAW
jgi:WD40 repeat protein